MTVMTAQTGRTQNLTVNLTVMTAHTGRTQNFTVNLTAMTAHTGTITLLMIRSESSLQLRP